MIRIALAVGLALLATSCGKAAKPEAATLEAAAPAIDPAVAAEKQKQTDAKAAFDAALAAKDVNKLDELALAGNGFALLHRAQEAIASQDINQQQNAASDMEAAAAAGNAEAQVWVGSRMAEGTDGFSLKPNSGIIMVEKAANQGYGPAMLELGRLYEVTLMRDPKKARAWREKAVAAGVPGAAEALAAMDKHDDEANP